MEQKGRDTYTKIIGGDILDLNVKELLNGVDLERKKRDMRTAESTGQALRLFYSIELISSRTQKCRKIKVRAGTINVSKDCPNSMLSLHS